VLQRACEDRRRWNHGSRHGGLEISVNVSAQQVMSPDFVRTVREVLRSTATDPKLLTLEVTESIFIEDSQQALVMLDGLKRLGVGLALDDFGTGYSSLSYLKDFPVGIVKIDQRFIADPAAESTSTIVSALVNLAHALQMTVVAEGVETAEQHRSIIALGCDSCQGFYFARPMSADANDSRLPGRPSSAMARPPIIW